MKKASIIIILLYSMVSQSFCQTVDSIEIEQDGNLVNIRYKILNSTPYQTFRITVSSSIDGGLKSELRSLTGDFGENITGGRPYYLVIWDVLSDVDEVSSFNITIKAELLKDQTPEYLTKKPVLWSKLRYYILPTVHEGHGVFPGLRIAYAENWGVTVRYSAGYYHDYDQPDTFAFHTSICPTKRILNKNGTQLHIAVGVSYAKESAGLEGYSVDYDNYWGTEYGFIIGIRRLVISAFGEFFMPNLEGGIEMFDTTYANFGFGMRF